MEALEILSEGQCWILYLIHGKKAVKLGRHIGSFKRSCNLDKMLLFGSL